MSEKHKEGITFVFEAVKVHSDVLNEDIVLLPEREAVWECDRAEDGSFLLHSPKPGRILKPAD